MIREGKNYSLKHTTIPYELEKDLPGGRSFFDLINS